MAAMIARVMLAVAAGVGICLYALVLAVAAVPMLIVSALRLATRQPEPALAMRSRIMRLDGVKIPQREEAAV